MGKDNSQKLTDKIFQFENLPEECSACLKPFDKKSKKMAATWNVVAAADAVRLYCPECWSTARRVVEEYKTSKTIED